MEITTETKVLIGIIAATLIIIVGGAWLSGRNQGPSEAAPLTEEQGQRLVREDDPVLGTSDAKVTVVEFGDFQCPACGALHPALKSVKAAYADQPVRFVFRQFPLTQVHEHAALAAEAAVEAAAQGKFWEYHDRLFENQTALAREDLERYGEELGLDMEAFRAALNDGTHRAAITQDISDGNAVGVQGTPTVFINGIQYTGGYSAVGLQAAIDEALQG